MGEQKRFPFLLVFLLSIFFGVLAALSIVTHIELSSTKREIIEKIVFYGLAGFIAVWTISCIGWLQVKHKNKRETKK